MKINENQWKSMKNQGNQWKIKENQWKSFNSGSVWKRLGLSRSAASVFPLLFSSWGIRKRGAARDAGRSCAEIQRAERNENQWKIIENQWKINGNQWKSRKSMKINENPWKSMNRQWKSIKNQRNIKKGSMKIIWIATANISWLQNKTLGSK